MSAACLTCVVFVLQNCVDKSREWMKNNMAVVLGIAFGIAILMVRTPPVSPVVTEEGAGLAHSPSSGLACRFSGWSWPWCSTARSAGRTASPRPEGGHAPSACNGQSGVFNGSQVSCFYCEGTDVLIAFIFVKQADEIKCMNY